MLAALLNVPHSPTDWSHFSFDHRDSHDRIRAAIRAKKGLDLSDYQIDPINPNNVQQFLENNAQLHTDMNGALNLQSANLEDVDLQDDKQLRAWIMLHSQEHFDIEQALGI